MIIILSGQKGEGKTTRITDLIRYLRGGFIEVGGICSPGNWKDGIRDYYEVVDIENGESGLLCDRKADEQDIPLHHFFFKTSGIKLGIRALEKTGFTHPHVLIIDEIGPLELEGKGWSQFLDGLDLTSFGVILLTVRESLIEEVSFRWKLFPNLVIKVTEWSSLQLYDLINKEVKKKAKEKILPVTGIILAGGKSSRFGKDKGLVSFQNILLINRAIERFRSLCREIIISSNSKVYQELGYPVIPDEIMDRGPMMGIYSCLKYSSTTVNLVVSVDTPMVPEGLYRELVRIKEEALVIVPGDTRNRFEPVIGLYAKEVIESMENVFNRNSFALPDLFKLVPFKTLLVGYGQPFSNLNIFSNINTPDDLAFLENQAWSSENIRLSKQ
jgi:molybdopterin-guanine dinucleotide biosynthesis protein A